jgi:hypothetical protein
MGEMDEQMVGEFPPDELPQEAFSVGVQRRYSVKGQAPPHRRGDLARADLAEVEVGGEPGGARQV